MSDHHPITHRDLEALKDEIMSALSEAIAKVQSSTDAAVGRVTTELTTLRHQVDTNSVTQQDLDALTAVQAKLDGLAPATNPPTP